MSLLVGIEEQSREIGAGVRVDGDDENLGAGDQGIMFGVRVEQRSEAEPAPR